MRMVLRVSCCFLTLLAAAGAQGRGGQVNPAPVEPGQANPFDTSQDAALGGRLFQTHCSYCHGAQGEGGRGADLTAGQYRFGGSDGALFNTIRWGIAGSEMGPVRAADDEVWRMVAFVKRLGTVSAQEKPPGDPAAGKVVYETKGNCSGCHVIHQEGGSLGPELTGIGRRRGIKFLEESLVKPEAEVPINYRAVRVVAASGETVVGIRLNEDDMSIQLRDTGGSLRSFLKDNLRDIRRDSPSLMPAYGSILTRKEIDDLVAYLSSLREGR